MRRILTALITLALVGVFAGCDTQEGPPDPQVSKTAFTLVDPVPTTPEPTPTVTPTPTPTVVPPVPVEKVLVIVEENHSKAQMKSQMPYLKSLGDKYGEAADYDGNFHPSQPNYIVMAAGDNLGVTNNSYHKLKGRSVFADAIAAGYKAKTTADGMGKTNRCKTTGSSPYAFRHNPWVSFVLEASLCKTYNYDYSYWAGDAAAGKLGNLHFLIPSNNHNGHDKSLKAADDWLKGALKYVFAGPDWQSGKLAIVVTADEDDKKSGQNVYTVVIHPSLNRKVVTQHLDHYALNAALYKLIHQTPRGAKAKTAPDLWAAFGLTVK